MTTDLVRLLKALADPTRVRIVHLLRGRDELCVCEIVDSLDIPQYSVSRHLGVLKAAGLVNDYRQGKWMHYAIHTDLSPRDKEVVAAVCRRADGDPTARRDKQRLGNHIRPRENGEVVSCD